MSEDVERDGSKLLWSAIDAFLASFRNLLRLALELEQSIMRFKSIYSHGLPLNKTLSLIMLNNSLVGVKTKEIMSVNPQDTQTQVAEVAKASDKEHNFAQIRQQLEREKSEKLQMQQRISELEDHVRRSAPVQEDDDDSEPYVDKKRLKKEAAKIRSEVSNDNKQYVQQEVAKALSQEREQMWMKANPDFYDIMQHAQALADKDPELAETILAMPQSFERQKLVYKNIKALGLHKKEEPKSSIQDKVDANRRSPYYQPSGVGSAPYAPAGDYSPSGQKNAYQKMQELKSKLRI